MNKPSMYQIYNRVYNTRFNLQYDKKTCFIIGGYLFSIGLNVVLLATFMYAYFFNNMQYYVVINNYGEATVELFLLFGLFILILIGFYYQYHQCKEGSC